MLGLYCNMRQEKLNLCIEEVNNTEFLSLIVSHVHDFYLFWSLHLKNFIIALHQNRVSSSSLYSLLLLIIDVVPSDQKQRCHVSSNMEKMVILILDHMNEFSVDLMSIVYTTWKLRQNMKNSRTLYTKASDHLSIFLLSLNLQE